MHTLQVWLVHTISANSPVAEFMRTAWAWPLAESLHFLGLCLLVGGIGAFDLRLLGVAKSVPIAAVHRLIPIGLLGFAINVTTGALFVATEPDQYIYNPAFHLKLVCLAIAGINAVTFYLTTYRQAFGPAATLRVPAHARVIAIVSISAWLVVIVAGRLITFYRPGGCTGEQVSVLLTCDPG